MLNDRIISHLESFDMDQLRDHLSNCPEPQDGSSLSDVIEGAIEWVQGLRRDLMSLISGIANEEDVEMAVAIQYVEMKSRWIAFNTKMNYELFRGMTPQARDMCRAAAVSTLLGHIEDLLKPEDIGTITEFLSEPIKKAA
ncbi:MAG: hypothetical protein Tsb0013_19480 [Phycisphaerales bacterium]